MRTPVFSFNPPKMGTQSPPNPGMFAMTSDNTLNAVVEDERPEAYVPQVEFTPLVEKLPDLVTTNTGEEQETTLFCQRARLYRWDKPSNDWKARGVGELKILEDTNEVKFRIVMRRDQVN